MLNEFQTEPVKMRGKTSKLDPIEIPGFGLAAKPEFDPNKFAVRYIKVDMDDPAAITDLEIIETRALRNQGVYMLSKDKFACMDRYFIVVSYMEEIGNANARK